IAAAVLAVPAAALRFWESPVPFVVVGYGNEIAREVNVVACEADGVPVLRRSSGGGTVIQGPGCLNYALVLPIASDASLATVSGANRFILHRITDALAGLLGQPVDRCGDTDLVWRDRKFSGNAQRRRRTHLLFHGTLLLGLDLSLVEKYLLAPTRQPDYRQSRPHGEFVSNLPLMACEVKQALAQAWLAGTTPGAWPEAETLRLACDQYSLTEWNRRR
ncbi:MAG: lipoate--protein ligase family protein, partial [Verrucomicrobia bacterium]|nr:lipoate--protein ligase family protein [Verrucomicrobiota bacterium]